MNLPTNPSTFPSGETNFLIDGPSGQLELLSFAAKGPAKGVAIICHPHPLQEGTMHNKVVHTLSRAFHRKDLHAIRFNYRGVGKSQGQYGNSVGEIQDLMAVLSWADTVLDNPKIWLAGFSFGAYIAAMGATQHACQQLFTVAPAVTHQPYSEMPLVSCPWTVIQGEADEVVSPSEVFTWFDRHAEQQSQMTLIKLPNASHFFHGDLIVLRTLVEDAFVEHS
ncbi:MAG: hypothetical protein BGO43_05560 [Gammaproteobacteria bacterium 39-13]|jgi:alpha/beta superfamily hydrolase|nr:alpha/beta hydrolase [Gammaproteobacteria bacterium]OJV91505.1 MAG: hypothetical protein BGO43_05560 [Gammaproteobacteria bacterium 39-13]